ncbi:LysM peptidoglycan-binding domain-containing protein [Lutimonas halocynthiae]|uniref:CIS tube protein n=1 Tax=Lutimonas halocynthiae TaxID=1446477 RepID=UPI0025B4E1C8|nr:LysM peptidoglycan-binding domain-containing protein [Lutimonas halocynthiae]MDN3643359.1 LysM peptidoglycan-binding domain-containing protein [Lutimonas halocynthiae]
MSLNKMKIVAYRNNKYLGKGKDTCVVKINPASYSHNHKVNYNNETSQGAPGTPLKFRGIPPETVSFDIYFDATGAIKYSKMAVHDQIKVFKNVCFDYNGDIHEPNYLILSWGTLVFKCKLTSLDINYSLFKPDGTPLRAKSSVKFEEASDTNTIAKEANPQSPDLTHWVLVKEGDTLPMICYDIYGDCSYYLEVAKQNKIINFRNLIPGTELYLPPIK